MSIEIKRSIKPIDYNKAIELLEKRIEKVINKTDKELIWFLEHNKIYTAGTSSVKSDILDKNVKIVKTSRGGKITCHSRGQLICYLVIDLTKRNKDIRKFIILLENSIIQSLSKFNISAKSDRKNIGIWIKNNNETKKISSIGIRVKKWIAYHGFSVNIDNNLEYFNKIIPCGIKDKKVVRLKDISKIKYSVFLRELKKNLIKNLSVSNYS
tara:strand:- start:1386 stop:2018 length:633 start_codon:yes stop_codon:yes gene_type:complete